MHGGCFARIRANEAFRRLLMMEWCHLWAAPELQREGWVPEADIRRSPDKGPHVVRRWLQVQLLPE